MKKPWWQQEVTIAWAMLLVFPLGTLLVWLYAPWRNQVKWVWTGFAVLMALVILGIAAAVVDEEGKSSSPTSAQRQPTAQATAPEAVSTPVYVEATATAEPETPTPNATATAQYPKPVVTPGPPLRIASYLKALATAAAGDMQSRYVQATATQQAQEQLSRYLEGVATSEANRAAKETSQAEPTTPPIAGCTVNDVDKYLDGLDDIRPRVQAVLGDTSSSYGSLLDKATTIHDEVQEWDVPSCAADLHQYVMASLDAMRESYQASELGDYATALTLMERSVEMSDQMNLYEGLLIQQYPDVVDMQD